MAAADGDPPSDRQVELFTWVNEVYNENSSYNTSFDRYERERRNKRIWSHFTSVRSTIRRDFPELYTVIFCRMTILGLFNSTTDWDTPENYCEAYNDGMMSWQRRVKDATHKAKDYRSDLLKIGFAESMLTDLRTHNYAIGNQIDFNRCCAGDADEDGICDAFDDCDFEPGPVDNNGCPYHPCDDFDEDGVCNEVDECPEDFGRAENNGCPTDSCERSGGDRDGDQVCDFDDLCPDVPGYLELDGCPEDVIEYRRGVIDVRADGTAFYHNETTGVYIEQPTLPGLVAALPFYGVNDTQHLKWKSGIGLAHNERLVGSGGQLYHLDFVDEGGKFLVLFPTGEFTIDRAKHPELFGDGFTEVLKGLTDYVQLLSGDLGLPEDSWEIQIIGSADKPTFDPKAVEDEQMRKQINLLTFWDIDSTSLEYYRVPWRLPSTFVNPHLPNSRSGWMAVHLRQNYVLSQYHNNVRCLDGKVTENVNPKERNATLFFRLSAEAKEALARKGKERQAIKIARANSGR